MWSFLKRPWVMALVIVAAALYFRNEILGVMPAGFRKFFKA